MPEGHNDKIAFVTGGTGFIGRFVVHALLREGYEVHVASHRWDGPFDPHPMLRVHHSNLLRGDDPRDLMAMIRPTHLLHLAWETDHGRFWNSPINVQWAEAGLRLLQEFQGQGGRRAVFAGSCAEYDWSSGRCHETETPLRPHSFYGVCKQMLGRVVSGYADITEMNVAWARLFHVYGPGQDSQCLIPSVAEALLRHETAICRHGNHVRDYLHVSDVAVALVAVLDSPVSGPVNIASGVPSKLGDLAGRLAEIVGGNLDLQIEEGEATADNPRELLADTTRLNQEIGWLPGLTINEGLRSVVSHMRQTSRSKAA